MFFVNEFFDERHFVNHYPKKKKAPLENVRCKGKKVADEKQGHWIKLFSVFFFFSSQ